MFNIIFEDSPWFLNEPDSLMLPILASLEKILWVEVKSSYGVLLKGKKSLIKGSGTTNLKISVSK
jgi:hypothetical protein